MCTHSTRPEPDKLVVMGPLCFFQFHPDRARRVEIRATPSRGMLEVPTGLFSLFWQPQRPPMATKGEQGDVLAPWGAWLAFGVAMVCSGGLPAVVWAGCCCCGEGRPSPLWGRCAALGVTHGLCNDHPTHRGPGKGRLWVGGGMGPCVGHVNAAMPTRSAPHGPLFCFCFLRHLKNRNPRATASKIVLCSALRCLPLGAREGTTHPIFLAFALLHVNARNQRNGEINPGGLYS